MKSHFLGLALLSLISSQVYAHGVRGGGHVVEVNGKLELVDLVTSATCHWISGQELIQQSSGVSSILTKIEKLDWYLALELKREIEYISWCMTGSLYSVPANDNDSFVQQLTRGVQQAAFRYNESAYIDQDKFNRLSPSSQAYLIFHEALHSYLPMGLEMRIFKLQSLVSTIRRIDLGQITNRRSLHLNLSQNQMDFPLTVDKLDSHRKSLSFILGPIQDRLALVLKTKSPESLIQPNVRKAIPYLAKWDQLSVQNSESSISEVLLEIFKEGNLHEVQFVLNEQTYERINPASVALSVYEELSPEVQELVKNSRYFAKIVQNGIDYLNGIRFSILNGRIISTENLQKLSSQCEEIEIRYTTSLSPMLRNKRCQLPTQLQAISNLLVIMARYNDEQIIRSLFLKNQELISTLRFEHTLKNLENLNTPISRERALAINVLKDIQKSMKALMINTIQEKLSSKEFELAKNFLETI